MNQLIQNLFQVNITQNLMNQKEYSIFLANRNSRDINEAPSTLLNNTTNKSTEQSLPTKQHMADVVTLVVNERRNQDCKFTLCVFK